jgi:hypothetical protein
MAVNWRRECGRDWAVRDRGFAHGVREGLECVVYGDQQTRLPLAFPGVSVQLLDGGWTQWVDQVSLSRRLTCDRISVFLSSYYKLTGLNWGMALELFARKPIF